jgi:integrase
MNAAIAEEWLTKVPKLARKVEKNKKIRSWLTHDQWDRLYAELPVHMRPMAQFAVESGLRQANVLQLRWSQLDLDRQLVWIEASEMKGGKAIAIPLSQGALEVLRGQVGQHVDFVFTFRSKPIKEIKTAFIAACVRAEVGQFDEAGKYSGFTWHGLRHTWATWHIQNGTPLEVLQKLGGWSDLRMVMNYAHHSPGHLASYANNTRATHDALHRKDDRPRPSNLTGHPDFQVSRQGHDLHGDA